MGAGARAAVWIVHQFARSLEKQKVRTVVELGRRSQPRGYENTCSRTERDVAALGTRRPPSTCHVGLGLGSNRKRQAAVAGASPTCPSLSATGARRASASAASRSRTASA